MGQPELTWFGGLPSAMREGRVSEWFVLIVCLMLSFFLPKTYNTITEQEADQSPQIFNK
jgi:hypothetical protein